MRRIHRRARYCLAITSGSADSLGLIGAFMLAWLLGGCPEGRLLGDACVTDSECTSGFCSGECLEPNADLDGDGVANSVEAMFRTNLRSVDTDGDGAPDGLEYGNPMSPIDSDGDGAIDAAESLILDDDDDCLPNQNDGNDALKNWDGPSVTELCGRAIVGVCAGELAQVIQCSVVNGALVTSCDESAAPSYMASELCGDGLDNNCDGVVDEVGCVTDRDGDGVSDDEDCAPDDETIYPGNIDVACDGIDQSCLSPSGHISEWNDTNAIFVDPSPAVVSGLGTREQPYATLGEALGDPGATTRTILVRQATISEPIVLGAAPQGTPPIRIVGGFDTCDYIGRPSPTVLSTDSSPSVRVSNHRLEITNFNLTANDSLGVLRAVSVEGPEALLVLQGCEVRTGAGAVGQATEGVAVTSGASLELRDSVIRPGGAVGTDVFGIKAATQSSVGVFRSAIELTSAGTGALVGVQADGNTEVVATAIQLKAGQAVQGAARGVVMGGSGSLLNSFVQVDSDAVEVHAVNLKPDAGESIRIVNSILETRGDGDVLAPTPIVGIYFDDILGGELEIEHTAVTPRTDVGLFRVSSAVSYNHLELALTMADGSGPAVTAVANLRADCQVGGGPSFVLDAGSPCLDVGLDLVADTPGLPASYAVAIDGNEREGVWDLGPSAGVYVAPACIADTDCPAHPFPSCVQPSCVASACVYGEVATFPDYDGDGVCDAMDDDDDDDGILDYTDRCPTSALPLTGVDEDSDGCLAPEDCNDNPVDGALFYPGAPDALCDGAVFDCEAPDGGTVYGSDGTVFVDVAYAGANGPSDGSPDRPRTSINQAIDDVGLAGGVIYVREGDYDESLLFGPSVIASAGIAIQVIGGRGCAWEPGGGDSNIRSAIDRIVAFEGAMSLTVGLRDLTLSHLPAADSNPVLYGIHGDNVDLTLEGVELVTESTTLGPGTQIWGIEISDGGSLVIEESSIVLGAAGAVQGIASSGPVRLDGVELISLAGDSVDGIFVTGSGVLEVFNSILKLSGFSGLGRGIFAGKNAQLINAVVDLAGGSGTAVGFETPPGIGFDFEIVGSLIMTANGTGDRGVVAPAGALSITNSVLSVPSGEAIAASTDTLAVRNCAIDSPTLNGVAVPDPGDGSLINDCTIWNCTEAFDNFADDCGLAGPSYTLAAFSACAGAGVWPDVYGITAPTAFVDRNGEPRPQGSGWDVGPDEVAE